MLFTNRYDRAGFILWLPVLTLLAGCGYLPLPLSVARSSGSTTIPINSPLATPERIASGDSLGDSTSEPLAETTSFDAATPCVEVDAQDAQPTSTKYASSQLVGCWRDEFCGQRTLTLKADGSATMLLELDFAGRLLYGKTIEFDMRWTLSESILRFEILTGCPLDAAESAIKLWGEAFEYRLELVDGEQLHAWAIDDSTLYKLRRGDDDIRSQE